MNVYALLATVIAVSVVAVGMAVVHVSNAYIFDPARYTGITYNQPVDCLETAGNMTTGNNVPVNCDT